MRIQILSKVQVPAQFVIDNFNKELFKALTPPLMKIRVLRFDGCKKGDEVHLELRPFPYFLLSLKWISHITENSHKDGTWSFIDEGRNLPFPFQSWHHTHKVIDAGQSSVISDDIHYSTGNIIGDALLFPLLYIQFFFRKSAYRKFLK